MMQFIKKFVIILIVLNLVLQSVPAFHIAGGFGGLLLSCLSLTILSTIIFSIINIILFPVHLLTMNMSNWVLRIFLVYIWSLFSPGVSFSAWNFLGGAAGPIVLSPTYLPYFLSVIVISLLILLAIEFFEWVLR